jgi:hypothetical protein
MADSAGDADDAIDDMGDSSDTAGGKVNNLENDIEALDTDLGYATAGANELKRAINAIPSSKTVTVTTKYRYLDEGGRPSKGNMPVQRAQLRPVLFRESANVRIHPGEWVMGAQALRRIIESVMGYKRTGGGDIVVNIHGELGKRSGSAREMGREIGREVVSTLMSRGLWNVRK